MFHETGPSPFGPDGPPSSMIEEGRRGHALELAVRMHCARTDAGSMLGDSFQDAAVLETAERFATWLRGAA